MSVYKRKGSPFYYYDFQSQGVRFCGTTGETSRRAALEVEKAIKAQAKEDQRHGIKRQSMTLNQAADRFWLEIGQHQKSAETTFLRLATLIRELGKDTRLENITENELSEFIARRRGQVNKHGRLPRPATINRELAIYRQIRNRARSTWKLPLPDLDFKGLFLEEPDGRVREASIDEERAFFAALRSDYHPIIEFMLLTGVRRGNAVLLEKRQVNWTDGVITLKQKSKKAGGRVLVIPMTTRIQEIIRGEWMHDPTRVWTYEVQNGRHKGSRMPMTIAGFKSATKRALAASGVEDFNIHDLRHTSASRLVRATGSLLHAQKVLGHRDIATTTRYAHAMVDDLRGSMEATETAYRDKKSRQNSRKSYGSD